MTYVDQCMPIWAIILLVVVCLLVLWLIVASIRGYYRTGSFFYLDFPDFDFGGDSGGSDGGGDGGGGGD